MGAKLTGSARTLTEPAASGATVGVGVGSAAVPVTGVAPGGRTTAASPAGASPAVTRVLMPHAIAKPQAPSRVLKKSI
jgi:hypothetical protein